MLGGFLVLGGTCQPVLPDKGFDSHMTIVFQIVLAIVVILFFVVAGMSSRTWRALHVTAVYLVFLTGFAFVVLAAASLKTKSNFKEKADRLEAQLAAAKAVYRATLYGDPSSDKQDESTLVDVRAQLTRMSLDRGRVWRQCRPQAFGAGSQNPGRRPTIVVETDATGAAPRPNRIDQGSILYVFREGNSAEGFPVPIAYVGEFQVTAAAADRVTMEPMHDLENYQVNQTGQAGTWVLYEIMPLDDHRVHVDPQERIQIEQDNISLFGTVDETAIREIFLYINTQNFVNSAQFPVEPLDSAQIDSLVNDRMRDGRRAEPGDPTNNVFMKVRFLKPHSVTVDYANVQSSLTSQYFDNAGTAISERLKRGEAVKFKVDQIGVLHVSDAQPLITDGTCELMERLYVRSLTDYDQLYFEIRTQLRELALLETAVQNVLKRLNAAEAKIDQQFTIRQEERVKLESDQENVDKERVVLKSYLDNLSAERKDLYDKLGKLYSANNRLTTEIAAAHERTQSNIDSAIADEIGATSAP